MDGPASDVPAVEEIVLDPRLNGGGPEVFCAGAFFYLQSILPMDDPTDPVPNRPVCF